MRANENTEVSFARSLHSHLDIDKALKQHITVYIATNSLVKLEAALANMVYKQFKPSYQRASDSEKQRIKQEIVFCSPPRQRIRHYLLGDDICFHHLNTLANFFELDYSLNNHDPATAYLKKQTSQSI